MFLRDARRKLYEMRSDERKKKMYKITIFLPNTTLYYTVETYTKQENKILFKDRVTGLQKEFPDTMCSIEEVEG